MHLRWSASPTPLALVLLPLRDRRGNPPPPQLAPQRTRIVPRIGSQLLRTLLGTSLLSLHPHSIYRLQGHPLLVHLGPGEHERQRPSRPIGDQMSRTALAPASVPDGISPFLAGTKLPARKAWAHSSLPCSSSVLKKACQMRSQVPSASQAAKRRWQVESSP